MICYWVVFEAPISIFFEELPGRYMKAFFVTLMEKVSTAKLLWNLIFASPNVSAKKQF